ncbi:MAG: class I SAM-dependent methyltransferase [archaeon]
MTNEDFYEKIDFDDVSTELVPELESYLQLEYERIFGHSNRRDFLLDIGCGTGRFLNKIADDVQTVVGIDNSNTQVERAVKNTKEKENITIELRDAEKLIFVQDNYFDLSCLTFNTYGNMDPRTQILAMDEAKRVTKPSGKIIVSVYSERAVPTQLAQYAKHGFFATNVTKDYVFAKNSEGIECISQRFEKEDLRMRLSSSGFKDVVVLDLCDIAYLALVTPNK